MMTNRRFPPPWTVEELDACFVVTDSANGAINERAPAPLRPIPQGRLEAPR
jgi:hypothetical protein